MKKLLLLTLLSTSVNALEFEAVQMNTLCSSSKAITEVLAKTYKELPLAMGKGLVKDSEGSDVQGITTIWVSPTENTFSVTFTLRNDPTITCVLITGTDLQGNKYENL